jgi:hypothetical protein
MNGTNSSLQANDTNTSGPMEVQNSVDTNLGTAALKNSPQFAELEMHIRHRCLQFFAHLDITSWCTDDHAIQFCWSESDQSFRCAVEENPLNKNDPPLCLLSVEQSTHHTLYASLVADLSGAGPLLIQSAIRSLILQSIELSNMPGK